MESSSTAEVVAVAVVAVAVAEEAGALAGKAGRHAEE